MIFKFGKIEFTRNLLLTGIFQICPIFKFYLISQHVQIVNKMSIYWKFHFYFHFYAFDYWNFDKNMGFD